MSHIFISYNHEDNDFAENLIHKLQNAAFTSWRDIDELRAGEVWRVEIDQAIKDAAAMIVIMTPEAKASEYVTYEWAFAFGVGVKVIPVMLRKTELHPRLEDIQYLDFTGKYRPWQQLIDSVQAIVSNKNVSVLIPRNTPLYIKKAIDALDSPNPGDRDGAISILIKDRNLPVVQKALIMALEHDLKDVRIQTALSIARFPNVPVQALRGLLDALHMKAYKTKAIEALEKMDIATEDLGKLDMVAIPELLNSFHDKDIQVRCGAIKALGLIGDTTMVPNLLQLSNDTSELDEVRSSAIFSLGKIANESAVLGLLDILHSEQKTLNDLTETLQKLYSSPAESETLDRATGFFEHREKEANKRVQIIVEILYRLEGDAKTTLVSNLHRDGCETCAYFIEKPKKCEFGIEAPPSK